VSKSKLTEVQKYYIEGHLHFGVTKIATEIGATVSSVKKYLTERVDELKSEPEEVQVDPQAQKTTHIITKTNGGRGGIAIMTEAGSMVADGDSKRGKGGSNTNVHTIR
jgi:hypothetical protein